MEKITSKSWFTLEIGIRLTEQEARALNAITEYGTESFIDTFYKYLGKSALKPHEEGLKSLFESIKKELPQHLKRADDAWKTLAKEKI
jgi:hypothetical protein